MTQDQRALLDGIIADPSDDVKRMVYADWLEERDETVDCSKCNGETMLVRSDVLGIMRVEPCEVCYGLGRVSNMFTVRATQIRNGCASPDSVWPSREPDFGKVACVWQRGFIRDVACTMAQWLEHGPAICSEHPVERVVITDKEPLQIAGLGILEFEWVFFAELEYHTYVLPNQLSQDQLFRVPFKSVSEAHAWLSAPCIAWAREQAYQLTTCDRPG